MSAITNTLLTLVMLLHSPREALIPDFDTNLPKFKECLYVYCIDFCFFWHEEELYKNKQGNKQEDKTSQNGKETSEGEATHHTVRYLKERNDTRRYLKEGNGGLRPSQEHTSFCKLNQQGRC